MKDFKFMDEVVNEICKSMREDPKRWLISTYLIEDLLGGVKYWRGPSTSAGINSIWTGGTTEKVFSNQQGYKILQAFEDLRKIKESEAQKKILNSFKSEATPTIPTLISTTSKKWWEFWK